MSHAVPVVRVVVDAPHRSDVVPSPSPVIGWVTETGAADWRQASADLELRRGDRVETARIDGDQSVRLAWPFEPLAPRERVSLRVRVTGADGAASEWSEPRGLVAGFLGEGEWVAASVGLASPTATAQPSLLRSEFDVDGEVVRATLYATAHGVYQVAVNGTDVDDQVMKPGWTPYQYRLIHETTDVTPLLVARRNAIGIRLAGALGDRGVRLPRQRARLLRRAAGRRGAARDRVRRRPHRGGLHRRDVACDDGSGHGERHLRAARTTTHGSRSAAGRDAGVRRRRHGPPPPRATTS